MKRLFVKTLHRLQLPESWVIFFILGVIMMTFPFLHIFNKPILILGVPLLFFYLTFGWIVSIIVIYLFMFASRREKKTSDESREL